MKATWECGALILLLLTLSVSPQENVSTPEEHNLFDILRGLEKMCGNDTQSTQGGCACDAHCGQYGDCCPDSPYFKPEEQKLGASTFICSDIDDPPMYVVASCPPGWIDPMVSYRCIHPDKTYRDPMRDVPVTSMVTNITYINSYCAACHRDLTPESQIWTVSIQCGIMPSILNSSTALYLQYLAYDTSKSYWYLNLTTDDTEPVYICDLAPVVPKALSSIIRSCDPYVVSKCEEDWMDVAVKEKCEAYTSHVCFGFQTFRNHHCVMCNNVSSSEDYDCSRDIFLLTSGIETRAFSPSFSVLLDWRSIEDDRRCDLTEIYDPVSRLCRPTLDLDKSEENLTKALGSCDKLSFAQEEYELGDDNASVYIPAHNKTYYKHEFLIHDQFIVMCVPEDSEGNLAPELGYFTLIGLSLSIVFIVLHLAVLFIVPKLRNFSAVNLSCLCISLLLLYCSFIASGSMVPRSSICVFIAVLIHYSLLASFFWMLTISFDIFRVMKQATSKLILSKGRQRPRFCLYCIGSWLFPAGIVGVGLAMDSWSPESPFAPAYGQGACWFNHPDALLVFCVAPLAVVVFFNVCFFSWTAHLIHVNSADSVSASTTRKEFPLFVRLGFIMGITWIIGIAAASVDVPGLWHLFVIFNTLQGLFIFLAFTCTRKVWIEVRNAVYKHKKVVSRTTTTTTTTTEGSTATRSSELAMQDRELLSR